MKKLLAGNALTALVIGEMMSQGQDDFLAPPKVKEHLTPEQMRERREQIIAERKAAWKERMLLEQRMREERLAARRKPKNLDNSPDRAKGMKPFEIDGRIIYAGTYKAAVKKAKLLSKAA